MARRGSSVSNTALFLVLITNVVVAIIFAAVFGQTFKCTIPIQNLHDSFSSVPLPPSEKTQITTSTTNTDNKPPSSASRHQNKYTFEELVAQRQMRLTEKSCTYHPKIQRDFKLEPYEENPTDIELTQCKEKVVKKWQFNHLPSSPKKFARFRRYPTFNFDALVKSTYCATNPNLVAAQKDDGSCFQKQYFTEIARIPAPRTLEEFEKVANRALPIIFVDYKPQAEVWKWTIDKLAEKLGHHEMKVRHGNYDDLSSRQFTKMTVAHFVDIVRGRAKRPPGMPPYLGNNKLSDKLVKELGYEPPFYFEKSHFNYPSLWVGAAGTETPLHKDGPDNFAYMVQGVKRWTIFPPEDLYTLNCTKCNADDFVDEDVGGNKLNGLCWCPNEGVVRDGDELPSGSQPYTFDLREGEMFYLPAGWLHSVQNVEETIMINQWMKYHVTPKAVWGPELIKFWARGNYQPKKTD